MVCCVSQTVMYVWTTSHFGGDQGCAFLPSFWVTPMHYSRTHGTALGAWGWISERFPLRALRRNKLHLFTKYDKNLCSFDLQSSIYSESQNVSNAGRHQRQCNLIILNWKFNRILRDGFVGGGGVLQYFNFY